MAEPSKSRKKKDDKAVVASTRAKQRTVRQAGTSAKEVMKDVGSGRTKGAEEARRNSAPRPTVKPSQARIAGPARATGTAVAAPRPTNAPSSVPRLAAPSTNLPAVRNAPGTQVGGLAGRIPPQAPATGTAVQPQPQAAPPSDMSAGSRPPMSDRGDSGLMRSILGVIGRYAPAAGAVASVMAPSPTNQGEAEWLAQGKPNPITPPSSPVSSGGAMAGSPLDRPVAQVNPERAPQRVSVAPSDPMSSGPRNAQAAPSNRSAGLPTKAAPSTPRKAPSGSPQSRPSGLSVEDKVAQLVAKGFSREDAMKLATAQGGKVNAPAGYKKGGLVKVNGAGDVKLKEPGKPRMPKMPAVGKAGTDGVVKAVIAKAKKPIKKVK